jgi:hypothetical protein
MTRTNSSEFMLRRAYEHFVASLGAIAVTSLLLASVNAHATMDVTTTTNSTLKPSVTILVPTVTIETVDPATGNGY